MSAEEDEVDSPGWKLFRSRLPILAADGGTSSDIIINADVVEGVASVCAAVDWQPCHGVLDFPDLKGQAHFVHDEAERAVQLGLAQYVTVDPTVDPNALLDCFENGWKMYPPSAVFSIAGGVSNLRMQTKLAQIITRGLAKAVRITQGWVITGGMDAGVARLVASGLRRAGVFAPVVGIARWEDLEAPLRDEMVEEQVPGRVLKVDAHAGVNRVQCLEPHHSHFIIVADPKAPAPRREADERDGPAGRSAGPAGPAGTPHASAAGPRKVSMVGEPEGEAEWCGDDEVRRSLEERLQDRVPRLLLAVQGEGSTFESVVQALKAKCGVIVVRESGGAALTIARFMDTLRPPHRKALTRQNPQYGSRADVPFRFVPWEVQHPAYKPAYYVSQSVIDADSSGVGTAAVAAVTSVAAVAAVASLAGMAAAASHEGAAGQRDTAVGPRGTRTTRMTHNTDVSARSPVSASPPPPAHPAPAAPTTHPTPAAQITVLNLLIAIMTDTYFNVARSGAAEVRWRMSRVNTNNDYLAMPPLPTPLDLPWLARELALLAWDSSQGTCLSCHSRMGRKAGRRAGKRPKKPTRVSTMVSRKRHLANGSEVAIPWEEKAREAYLKQLQATEQTASDDKAIGARMTQLQDAVSELHATRRDERQLLLELRNKVLSEERPREPPPLLHDASAAAATSRPGAGGSGWFTTAR